MIKWKLKIDSKKQMIQGCHIPDSRQFQIEKFAVMNECSAGWQPNHQDIVDLTKSYHHPSQTVMKWIRDSRRRCYRN